jgi:hypothetical protein
MSVTAEVIRLSSGEYPGARPGPTTFITHAGLRVDPFDLQPDHIRLEDIAHALSMQCRFIGHVRKFYSVAQHSVLVSWTVPRKDALWGLLHDASEAYCTDLIRPIKHAPGFETYKRMEEAIERVIAEAFELPWPRPNSVTIADRRLLQTERRDLKGVTLKPPTRMEDEPLDRVIQPWSPEYAKRQFLRQYLVLADPLNPAIARM